MKSGFYRDHDAEFDARLSNQPQDGNRWRVNDETISLDPTLGDRWETQANGLLLIEVNENLRDLSAAELVMEVWGGHPHTRSKRFIVNGKGIYPLPEVGTADGHCTYSYPCIPIALDHLVTGMNALQFACERGESFWGHFILDTASVRCYLDEKCALSELEIPDFQPRVATSCSDDGGEIVLSLDIDAQQVKVIQQVDYFGRYFDFDDQGTNSEAGWHGFAQNGKWHNHIGTAVEAPFAVGWNTEMLPDQTFPMAFYAEIALLNGLKYRSPIQDGIWLQARPYSVRLINCITLPVPFWSRAGQECDALFHMDIDASQIEKAWLNIRIWDGGEGDVKHPFLLNGHPYSITSGKAVHDLVFTQCAIDPHHLRTGENRFRLLSDSEHHGIEVLLPGPSVKIKFPREAR